MTVKPENLETLLSAITPEIHAQLKEAVALGRWESGDKLTDEQRSLCLQAVIAYDEKYLSPDQRVGYVKPKNRACDDKAGKQ